MRVVAVVRVSCGAALPMASARIAPMPIRPASFRPILRSLSRDSGVRTTAIEPDPWARLWDLRDGLDGPGSMVVVVRRRSHAHSIGLFCHPVKIFFEGFLS